MLTKIADALKRTNYEPLTQVELHHHEGTVVLVGLVPTYFLKQVAQVAAMSVSGVQRIDNQLRVVDEHGSRQERAFGGVQSTFGREASLPQRNPALAFA